MRMMSSIYRLLALAVVLLYGCQELPRYFASDEPLAKVGDRELTLSEVAASLPEGVSGNDSAAYAKVYIDRWVRKQLKLNEAEQLFSASGADIDRMVEEYRQALLIRKLEQHYVDRLVDTTFTDGQIATYYTEHQQDFRLDHTVVKGRVVRFPKSYRQQRRLRELMESTRERDQQDFRDICLKNEFELTDFDERWVAYSDFLSLLPTVRKQSYEGLLNNRKVQQMSDQASHYYFMIEQVRRPGEPTPIEQLRPTIRRILFNQRQQQLIRDHEAELYEAALLEGTVELYEATAGEAKDQE